MIFKTIAPSSESRFAPGKIGKKLDTFSSKIFTVGVKT